MNSKRNRKIALVIAVLMLTMAFSTTGFAAWMGKTIEAQYRNITIMVNGQYKEATNVKGIKVEPFIVDGTTYVPLRGISEILGYKVDFNPATYRIDITGDVTGSASAFQYQLLIKDARIAELEAQLADKKDSSIDLDDLESDLIKSHKYIGDVKIQDIILKEKSNRVTVGIEVNLRYIGDEEDWDDLTTRNKENFLQGIIDDILKEYKSTDVTGYIKDTYSGDNLLEFSIDKYDDVVLGKASSSKGDLYDLEEELNDDFGRISGVRFTIKVSEKSKKNLFVELKTSNRDMVKEITEKDIKSNLEDIYDVIVSYKDYEDYTIYGDIIDKIGPIEFDYSKGKVNIVW